MLAFIFFVVLAIQIAANKLVDQKRILNGRICVLVVILLMYWLVLPFIFTGTLPEEEGVRCGLPVLALIMRFWIFGTIISIITHIIYSVVNGKQKIYPDD